MADIPTTVIGADGHSPDHDPARGWRQWNLNEVYLGAAGAGKYVPNVEDVVTQISGRQIQRFIVTSVNAVTLVPVLTPEEIVPTSELPESLLPLNDPDVFRAYIDRSVTPHTLALDPAFFSYGSMLAACKVFLGVDTSASGTVVSRRYNASGALLGEELLLEAAQTPLGTNLTAWVVAPGHTNLDLPDGELLTAVLYDNVGRAVKRQPLLVVNTAYMRSRSAAQRYVSDVSLESPFFNASTQRLEFPVGVTLASLNLMGVVHYSDGSSLRLPVNGTRFALHGLEQYTATLVGQDVPLVLTYTLAADEVNYNAHAGSQQHISRSYEATTLSLDGAYQLKLFAYPRWVSAVSGYRLTWWLYSLERDWRYDVTALVKFANVSPAFDPLAYDQLQRLAVWVNLRDVDPSYKDFNHVQSVDIVLKAPASDNTTPWEVGFSSAQTPRYGEGVYATAQKLTSTRAAVKLHPGASSQAQWLQDLYYNTLPLYDERNETAPPVPTHFALVTPSGRFVFALSEWSSTLAVDTVVVNRSTLWLQFIHRTTQRDWQLAVAGLTLREVNASGSDV